MRLSTMGNVLRSSVLLLRLTVKEWLADKALRLGAALAFYTVLSLAPLLLVTIASLGLFYGEQAAKSEIYTQIEQVVGAEAGEFVRGVVKNAARPSSGLIASALGIAALFMGATGVFVQLQDALNTIWGVTERKYSGIVQFCIDRLKSFTLILSLGFLLLISLVLSAGLAAASAFVEEQVSGSLYLFQILNVLVSWAIVTFLFAAIYKLLPDEPIEWRDVIIGACLTSVLFSAGKYLLSFYFEHGAVGSVYGAAGSLVILLLWVYYGSQILFLGAEFTKVYAREFGSKREE